MSFTNNQTVDTNAYDIPAPSAGQTATRILTSSMYNLLTYYNYLLIKIIIIITILICPGRKISRAPIWPLGD